MLIALWLSAIVSSICCVTRGRHMHILISLGSRIQLLWSTTSNRDSVIEVMVMWNELLTDGFICVRYCSIRGDSLRWSSLPFVSIATWRISNNLFLRARPKLAQDLFSEFETLLQIRWHTSLMISTGIFKVSALPVTSIVLRNVVRAPVQGLPSDWNIVLFLLNWSVMWVNAWRLATTAPTCLCFDSFRKCIVMPRAWKLLADWDVDWCFSCFHFLIVSLTIAVYIATLLPISATVSGHPNSNLWYVRSNFKIY